MNSRRCFANVAALFVVANLLLPGCDRVTSKGTGPRDSGQDSAPESVLGNGKRVALVIGNGKYKKLPRLDACPHDAERMAEAFQKIGIKVHGGKPLVNLTVNEMDAALNAFVSSLDRGSEAFIYYSGHGTQMEGGNYLLPVDFDAEFESQAKREAIALDDILALLEKTQSSLRVVILDACRDPGEFLPGEPALKGLHSKGLGEQKVDAPETLVCFATKHGTAALADESASFYSRVLAEEIVKPGRVEDVMKAVTRRVYAETEKRQLPFTYGSLLQDHFFAGPGSVVAAAVAPQIDVEAEIQRRMRIELAKLTAPSTPNPPAISRRIPPSAPASTPFYDAPPVSPAKSIPAPVAPTYRPRAFDDSTVKVGVLHSLSGTMAISETSLRDTLLFAFDEINRKGGVLGRRIEPVVVDGASNWPLFAEKAKQLLEEDGVAVTFGCWTSVSRKAVLPVFEKDNGLLFYPVQYEGEELSKNIFYTAETVNQQATPAIDYLLAEGKKKFYLLGSDYVYPQTTNLILLEYLLRKGIPLENIGGGFRKDEFGKIISAGKYTPFGHTDYQQIVAEIRQFDAGGKACVINTLNGDTNVPFFKEYAAAGLTAETCPVVSFSISEDEFRGLPARQLVGQLGCWTYFESIKSPANKRFLTDFQAWLKNSTVPGIVKEGRVTCSPMVLSYDGVYLWKAAVEKAGSFNVDNVIAALENGISFDGPGGTVTTQKNHHLTKNVFIGETKADGQFKLLKEYRDVFGEPFLKGTFR